MLTKSTKKNLARKSSFVDSVQFVDGKPLFSWIDINVTELCNRTCAFCPRHSSQIYPNQKLHMAVDLAKKINMELSEYDFQGAVVMCGYSEPLLHPKIIELVEALGSVRSEIVTNGDKLTVDLIKQLYAANLSQLVVSMYDGPEQIEHFTDMFNQAGIAPENYILRDRWYGPEHEYGLKLTNRAGVLQLGEQDAVDTKKPCYYTAYSMTIDWNGDVLLCVQDWHKKVKMGNIFAESLLSAWNSTKMQSFRSKLINGRRVVFPCNQCNAEGTLHGYNHADEWRKNGKEIPVKCIKP